MTFTLPPVSILPPLNASPRYRLGGSPIRLRQTHPDVGGADQQCDHEQDTILRYPYGGVIVSHQDGRFSCVVCNSDIVGTLAECEAFLADNWVETSLDGKAHDVAYTFRQMLTAVQDELGIDRNDQRDPDEYCDPNQIVLDAFAQEFGREAWMMGIDAEEGICTEEDANRDGDVMDRALSLGWKLKAEA